MSKRWTSQPPSRALHDVIIRATPEISDFYASEARRIQARQQQRPIVGRSRAATAQALLSHEQFHLLRDPHDPTVLTMHGLVGVFKPAHAPLRPLAAYPDATQEVSVASFLRAKASSCELDGAPSRAFTVLHDVDTRASGVMLATLACLPTPELKRAYVGDALRNLVVFYELMVHGHVSHDAVAGRVGGMTTTDVHALFPAANTNAPSVLRLDHTRCGFYGAHPVSLVSLMFRGLPSAHPPRLCEWASACLGAAVVGDSNARVRGLRGDHDFPRTMVHLRRVLIDVGRTARAPGNMGEPLPVTFGAARCLGDLVTPTRFVEGTERLPSPVPSRRITVDDGLWTPRMDHL